MSDLGEFYDYDEYHMDFEDERMYHDDALMTPEGPADMLTAELLDTHGDPWGDADL